MKNVKLVFGMICAASIFASFNASANTVVSCQWQFISSSNINPYGTPGIISVYQCKDTATNGVAAIQVLGSGGYVSNYCQLNPTQGYTYTGDCRNPTVWRVTP